MKNPKKYFFYILFFIYFVLPFIIEFVPFNTEESTGPNDYARITDVDYKAVLVDNPNEGGKVIITEKLTYDIHAASRNNLFWELWRDLPEDYVDGLNVDYQVNYVKQLNKDGTETIYTRSPKLYWDDSDYTNKPYGPGKWYHSTGPYNEDLARYECVFFYVDGLYREEVTFEIQYEMNNAALRYSDVSELYLSMYSEETIEYLESFKGQILISNKDMPKKGNYLAHTYGTNYHTFEYEESNTINPGYHTFMFDLDKDDLKFKNYNQYLEFSLLSYNNDKHIFTNYAPSNLYSNDVYLNEALDAIEEYDNLPIKAKKNKTILLIISIGTSILIIRYITNRDKKIRQKHELYSPTTSMQYFRDIPSDLDPHFASTLAFSKHKKKVDIGDSYSALMLSLVRKGYIELQKIDNTKDWTFDNILLNILYTPTLTNTLNQYNTNTLNTIPSSYSENIVNYYKAHSLSTNTQLNSNNTNNTHLITPQYENVQQQLINNTNVIEQPIIEHYNKKGKKLENLSPNEETYFNLIIKHSNGISITMKTFQEKVAIDYDNTDTFVTAIENSIVNIGVSQKYFQKANYNELKNSTNLLSTTYMIFGIIILTIGNIIISNTRLDLAYGSLFIISITLIISSIYLKKFANKYVLLTQFGEDEYAKWHALYNFLNSETLMKEKTVIELPLWEKYLVYATAFGISEKVIKALEIRCPNTDNSEILSNDYYRSRNFRTNSRSFSRSTRNASSTSRASRYSSGGSYYGGGGRGGGGGGGGH